MLSGDWNGLRLAASKWITARIGDARFDHGFMSGSLTCAAGWPIGGRGGIHGVPALDSYAQAFAVERGPNQKLQENSNLQRMLQV